MTSIPASSAEAITECTVAIGRVFEAMRTMNAAYKAKQKKEPDDALCKMAVDMFETFQFCEMEVILKLINQATVLASLRGRQMEEMAKRVGAEGACLEMDAGVAAISRKS